MTCVTLICKDANIFTPVFNHYISDMPFSKKETARTHSESRKVVCCVCARKVNEPYRGITEKLELLIRKFVYNSYSVINESHPTGICSTCRVTLGSLEKVS